MVYHLLVSDGEVPLIDTPPRLLSALSYGRPHTRRGNGLISHLLVQGKSPVLDRVVYCCVCEIGFKV